MKIIDANFRYTNLVSTTTRQPRQGEVEGVDYYFVSKEKFEDMAQRDLFVECVHHGEHAYGLQYSEIEGREFGVVVVNPEGVKAIKAVYGDTFKAVYIDVEPRERLVRQILRGDDIHAIVNRYDVDEWLFKDAEQLADVVINANKMAILQVVTEVLESIR